MMVKYKSLYELIYVINILVIFRVERERCDVVCIVMPIITIQTTSHVSLSWRIVKEHEETQSRNIARKEIKLYINKSDQRGIGIFPSYYKGGSSKTVGRIRVDDVTQ